MHDGKKIEGCEMTVVIVQKLNIQGNPAVAIIS